MIIRSILFAGLLLGAMPVSADDQGMTQEEYEAYRARIQGQLEQAGDTVKPQTAEGEEAAPSASKGEPAGYGQGYRARQERSGGQGMAGRASVMQRGGGRR